MGEGLKRVAKALGGLTATNRKITVRYDEDGNAYRCGCPFHVDACRARVDAEGRCEDCYNGGCFPKGKRRKK